MNKMTNKWSEIVKQPVSKIKDSFRKLTLGDVMFMNDYYSGVSKDEICLRYNISTGTIKSKVSKINKKLALKKED